MSGEFTLRILQQNQVADIIYFQWRLQVNFVGLNIDVAC